MLNLGSAVSIQMKVSRNSLSSNFHHLSGVYLEGAPSFRVLRPVCMYVRMLYSANITLNDSFGSHPPLAIGDGKPHETERALYCREWKRKEAIATVLRKYGIRYSTVHDWRYLCRTLICNGCQVGNEKNRFFYKKRV